MADDTYRGYSKEQVEARMKEGLTAWAEKKWPELVPVTNVEFDVGYDAGWSEYTPGVGAYTEVTITSSGKDYCHKCSDYFERRTTKNLGYDSDLINELLFFMFVGDLP